MTALEANEPVPKILVVDDNEQNRALVEATLGDEGYRVISAAGGEEGFAAFTAEAPDCVLLDVKMPNVDGLAVCRRIRAHARGADTPVVFLTALRDVDTFDEAQSAGGDDFLTKPVRPTELLIRVQAALRLRRLTAENRSYYETVRQQRDALMRVQLQKEQLMAFVVHDLKNPVTAMDLHAQLLLRDKALSEPGRESAQSVREEARLLMRLIQNLLDLSRNDAGELVPVFAPVDLRKLVTDIAATFELRAQDRGVKLVLELAPLVVHVDLDLFRRLVENLLDNSLRHAPSGSAVFVHLLASDDYVELRVRDEGSGIPEAQREQVFERFVQVGGPETRRKGYGLGLAFCKLAAELHRGRVWVEDGAPGALFCVRFPRDA